VKNRPRLTVYSRAWCHLCDELMTRLRPLCQDLGADIEIVDVDEQPEFEPLHGTRVPVVMCEDKELCHYHLDEAAVRAYLLNFR